MSLVHRFGEASWPSNEELGPTLPDVPAIFAAGRTKDTLTAGLERGMRGSAQSLWTRNFLLALVCGWAGQSAYCTLNSTESDLNLQAAPFQP
jgi:hypothetical protein